jgi:phosphoribosylformimino-5-aminoimidazole carboxamide ribotide isomerase
MLIPSIDLQGGRVVQLVQGERLAWSSDDVNAWIQRFSAFPLVQVIDLDAAKGEGSNRDLVRSLCQTLPCQVGGGIRTPRAAMDLMSAGARRVIVGSALFGRDFVDRDAASLFADAVGVERLVAAVDGRAGRVVVRGWRASIDVPVTQAIVDLATFAGTFLATLVDGEGQMGGLNRSAALELKQATSRRVIVAGGIRTPEEVDWLDAHGMDAVVGMAIYTGLYPLPEKEAQ